MPGFQKGLSLPTGLGIVMASKKVQRMLEYLPSWLNCCNIKKASACPLWQCQMGVNASDKTSRPSEAMDAHVQQIFSDELHTLHARLVSDVTAVPGVPMIPAPTLVSSPLFAEA